VVVFCIGLELGSILMGEHHIGWAWACVIRRLEGYAFRQFDDFSFHLPVQPF